MGLSQKRYDLPSLDRAVEIAIAILNDELLKSKPLHFGAAFL